MSLLSYNKHNPQTLKHMGRKILFTSIILLIAICLSGEGFAQKSEVSLDIGYGSTTTDYSRFLLPFMPGLEPFYQIGGKYMLTTYNSELSFFGGMTLDSRTFWDRSALNYLKVPIGMNLNIGRNSCFIIGGGINIGMLLTEPIDNNFSKFTFGTFVKAGPAFRLSNKYRLTLSYQANFDVSVMYVEHRTSPGGSHGVYDIKGDDRFLVLSLYKSIGNSNNNPSPVR